MAPLQFHSRSFLQSLRVTLFDDGVLTEECDSVGRYYPFRHVFWDEVRAVYVWKAPDWGPTVTLLLVSLLPFLFMALVPRAERSPLVLISGCFLLGSALAAAGALAWPARWVQIDSPEGPVRFRVRKDEVLRRLGSHLDLAPTPELS